MTDYTYDDPRLTYDEACFYYDSPYDILCLSQYEVPPVIVGRSFRARNEYREKLRRGTYLRFKIRCSVFSVNCIPATEEEQAKSVSFEGTVDPPNISILTTNLYQQQTNGIVINAKDINVTVKNQVKITAHVLSNNSTESSVLPEGKQLETKTAVTTEKGDKLLITATMVATKTEHK